MYCHFSFLVTIFTTTTTTKTTTSTRTTQTPALVVRHHLTPPSTHDTMHHKLHIATKMPTATLITRNSTPQHAPSSSRTRTTSVSVGVPEHPVKVKPPLTIVGDVNGRIAIMVVSMNYPPYPPND